MKPSDVEEVRKLAAIVWRHTYSGILPLGIQEKTLQEAYSAATMEKRFSESFMLVAEAENEIKGYAFFSAKQDQVHLGSLYIHPDNQRQGIGKALYEKGMAHYSSSKKVSLLVMKGNDSIHFHKKQGFTADSEWTGVFSGFPVTFIRMTKELC